MQVMTIICRNIIYTDLYLITKIKDALYPENVNNRTVGVVTTDCRANWVGELATVYIYIYVYNYLFIYLFTYLEFS